MLGQILTILITLIAIGCTMYIAHKVSKSDYARNMDAIQRLELSVKIGLPIAIILIFTIVIIARITK